MVDFDRQILMAEYHRFSTGTQHIALAQVDSPVIYYNLHLATPTRFFRE